MNGGNAVAACSVEWCVALSIADSAECAVHRRRRDLRTELCGTSADVSAAPDPDECEECNGDGQCRDCDGDGDHQCEHARCDHTHECPTCDGTGDCPECEGKGTVPAGEDTDNLTADERAYLRFAFNLDAPVWQAGPLTEWPWDAEGEL